MSRVACLVWALLWGAFGPLEGGCQKALSHDQKQADVVRLDSMFGCCEYLNTKDLNVLSSRDDLLYGAQNDSLQSPLSWALLVHGWLRSVNDAHIRIRFERMADSSIASFPPPDEELLRESGTWEGFAPGRGTAQCARLAWLKKTWPWLGALVPGAVVGSHSTASEMPDSDLQVMAGMAVVDHGAFKRWVIQDFSSGTEAQFKRSFRRCIRALRRDETPVLLDLRGNLGGFRTRRHAVLSFFLEPSDWPEEREADWGAGDGPDRLIPPMPALRVSRQTQVPLAILVDGLSFSASLLLADALISSGRGNLFGVRPLGLSGGCSGSPEDHVLPGSGLIVTRPTLRTSIGSGPQSHFDLPEDIEAKTTDDAWTNAVRWLLAADLILPR